MTETWTAQIAGAYGDNGLDPSRVEACYQAWAQMQQTALEQVEQALRDEIVGDLVADKVEQIRTANPDLRPSILAADEIDVQLTPIDRRALAWAESVLAGSAMDETSTGQAKRALDTVDAIAERTAALPDDLRGGLQERISDTKLDLIFALEGGDAPKSLRLARGEG